MAKQRLRLLTKAGALVVVEVKVRLERIKKEVKIVNIVVDFQKNRNGTVILKDRFDMKEVYFI